MRTKTSQQSEKILTVAARLFASHRFHETRMEDIAAAAEVGKGTLYRYFKDKEELYTALLNRASDQLSERLRQGMEPIDGTRAKLELIVDVLIRYFDEQPHLFDLIQHAEAIHQAERGFAWQKTREDMIRLVRGIFAAAKATGECVIDDPGLAALLLLGGVRAVIRFGERPRPEDLGRQIVDRFLHGSARPLAKANGRNHTSSTKH